MDDQSDLQHQQAYHTRLEAPVEYVPQRVVSLVPSLTEALFDLDLNHRLIAISDDCTRPAGSITTLPQVGSAYAPDVERIIRLQPDLVLANAEATRPAVLDTLRDAGLPVWVTDPRTVFEVLNLLWNVMDLFDHADMVPRVREIERAYDYTLAAAVANSPVRVFVPTGRDPWRTFNADTYAHDVLRVCGGDNVFGGREERYPSVTLEDIVAARPEVILLPNDPYPFAESDAASLRALDIPAARHGRIHLIDGSLLTWHGTRVAYTLRDLPPLLMGST